MPFPWPLHCGDSGHVSISQGELLVHDNHTNSDVFAGLSLVCGHLRKRDTTGCLSHLTVSEGLQLCSLILRQLRLLTGKPSLVTHRQLCASHTIFPSHLLCMRLLHLGSTLQNLPTTAIGQQHQAQPLTMRYSDCDSSTRPRLR
jgi:hypothetical protein